MRRVGVTLDFNQRSMGTHQLCRFWQAAILRSAVNKFSGMRIQHLFELQESAVCDVTVQWSKKYATVMKLRSARPFRHLPLVMVLGVEYLIRGCVFKTLVRLERRVICACTIILNLLIGCPLTLVSARLLLNGFQANREEKVKQLIPM